jgi:hypothetical protein
LPRSIDATTIDLCLPYSSWAQLPAQGDREAPHASRRAQIPTFVAITRGKASDTISDRIDADAYQVPEVSLSLMEYDEGGLDVEPAFIFFVAATSCLN